MRPILLSLAVFLGACTETSLATDGGGPDTASAAADTAGSPLDAGPESAVPPQTECPWMLHALPGFNGSPCSLPPEKTCMYLGGQCQCGYHIEEVYACRGMKWEKIMSTTCPVCPPRPPPGDGGS